MHFVLSLLTGRCFFEDQKNKFQRLPTLTLFIEADCQANDLPFNLSYNVVTMEICKSSSQSIVKEAMSIVSENLPENVRPVWTDIHQWLTQWHLRIRQQMPSISDHTLFRTMAGIMFYLPEDLESQEDFQQFVASELVQEYSAFLPTESIRQQVEEHIPALREIIRCTDQEEMAFMYKMPKEKGGPPHVEVQLLPAAIKQLNLSYGHIRGKSYDDRLVLSTHYRSN